ncbi:MAG: YfhO family protein [Chloroflexota bacterium]|nr:YfhO family protein [Chloroflexota bacterium]
MTNYVNSMAGLRSVRPATAIPADSLVAEEEPRVAARARYGALTDRRWFPDLVGVLAVLAVTGVLSWHRLALENGLGYLDIPTFYLPWYAHLGEAIRALDIPGWNPYQFSGTPFAGDPQSGWWYFPAMFFFTVLDPVPAYQAFLIFHLALAGLGTYWLCRIWGMAIVPSLLGGAAYQSGPFVSHVSCCLIHVQLATWIPLALVGVEQIVRSAHLNRRAMGWLITGFSMSQMIAGWPGQGMYNGCLLVGGYLAFRLLLSHEVGALGFRDRVVRLAGDSAGVLGFALLWAAAGILPRIDIVSRTNVAWGEYDGFGANRYSDGWSVSRLLDVLLSDNNGYQSLLFYLGAPVIVLAVAGIVLAWRKPWVQFMTVVTVLSSIMALHPNIVHKIVFLLPRYEELHSHVPSRVLAVQWIGPVVLVAAATDALLRSPSRRDIVRAAVIGFALWSAGALWLWRLNWEVKWPSTVGAVMATLLIGLFAITTTPPRERYGRFVPRAQALLAILLLLVVVADPAGRRLVTTLRTGETMSEVIQIPTGPVPRAAIEVNAASTDPGGAGEFLQSRRDAGEYFRFFGYENVLQLGGEGYLTTYREHFADPVGQAILINARAMRLHLNDIQGYNPVQLQNYVNYLTALNGQVQNYHDAQILPGGLTSPLLNILNARYVVIPADAAGSRPREDVLTLLANYPEVFRTDTVRVLENPNAMPRVWLAHEVVTMRHEEILGYIAAPGFDPSRTVVLETGAGVFSTGQPPNPGAESVEIVSYSDDTIVLQVEAAANGMVVLSETYEKGWHATVDGEAVDVEEAYGIIRAVPVSAGSHRIVLTYDPWSLRIGFYLSLGAAALSLVVIAWFALRKYESVVHEVAHQ